MFIGLDASTHGTKAIAWSATGKALAQARSHYPLHNPQPGFYEQTADDWVTSALDALAQLPSNIKSQALAIAITHQRETAVPVDKSGLALRPAIVWMDERALAQVHALRQSPGPAAFHKLTGKPLSITPSISRILWVHQHEPHILDKLGAWLDVSSFLIHALVGERVTSTASVDPMGLLNIETQTFSHELLRLCQLSTSQVPRLCQPGEIVGYLQNSIASKLGFPQNTPIVATGGDGQVAALGAGVLNLDTAYLNLGTAVVAGSVSKKPLISNAFRTMLGACPGSFLLESDLKGGTFTIDWLVHRLLNNAVSIEELERSAANLPPGSDGLVLLPYFASVMNPYWDDLASGVFLGLRSCHLPAHLYRAILEGIAMEQRLALDSICAASGDHLRQVHILGGGAQSSLWCQILADTINRPVIRTESPEATSLGAAILAAQATKQHESINAAVDNMCRLSTAFYPSKDATVYQDLYSNVYKPIYPSLKAPMAELARIREQR
jgi:xylulokinase